MTVLECQIPKLSLSRKQRTSRPRCFFSDSKTPNKNMEFF